MFLENEKEKLGREEVNEGRKGKKRNEESTFFGVLNLVP